MGEYLENEHFPNHCWNVTRQFSISRDQLRELGFIVRKDQVKLPGVEVIESMSDETMNKVLSLLSRAGGVLPYNQICSTMGTVTKAQLEEHFELHYAEGGICEVRIPGCIGEASELWGGDQPPVMDHDVLEESRLQEVVLYMVEQGGTVDTEIIRKEWPDIKKKHLRDYFDVKPSYTDKLTKKRLYNASLIPGREYPGLDGPWVEDGAPAMKRPKVDGGQDKKQLRFFPATKPEQNILRLQDQPVQAPPQARPVPAGPQAKVNSATSHWQNAYRSYHGFR